MSDCNCLQWWLAGLAAVIGFVYWTFRNAYKFWESRGIPTIEPSFPFGNSSQTIFGKESIGFSVQNTYNACKGKGPYAGYYTFSSPRLIVLDPEAVKNIMVKDFQYFHDRGVYHNERDDPLSAHLFAIEGERWKRLRTKLSPTFTSGKMKLMYHTMIESANELKAYMKETVPKESTFEVKDVLARFTTDIIGSCALGIQCNTLKNPEAEFREIGRKMFKPSFGSSLKRLIITAYKPLGYFLRIRLLNPQVTRFFLKAVDDTMKYRQENNITRNDFLQLLMQLRTKGVLEDNDEGEVVDDKTILTLTEAAAQAFVFFVGGFETSSSTMSFCLYELAVNPDIQKKVREEINRVLEKNGGELTYETALQMEYLDRVIYETMRKYPTLPILIRECTKDYTLPGTTTRIPRGTTVFIPVRGLHHDPEIYPDPDRFDPDRFTEENKSKRHHFAYLPFGEGPRICIGMRFGMMQTRLGLITMIRNFNILRSDKTPVPLKIDPRQFLTSSVGGIWLKFKPIA